MSAVQKEPPIKKDLKVKVKKEPKQRKRLTPSLAPITKKDVQKLGGTPNCKGCEFHEGKLQKRRPHCMPCIMRFQFLFVDQKYTKGIKLKERFEQFLKPREIKEETEQMDIQPAPINEEPINENNDIEDLYDLNFDKLSMED